MALRSSCAGKWIRSNLLLILTLLGVVVGFGLGFGLRRYEVTDSMLLWTGLPGELFMRMLKVSLLPLLISCVIVGVSSLEPKSSGKVSLISMIYIVITNAAGSLIGLAVVMIVAPGSGGIVSMDTAQPDTKNLMTEDIFADLIRNLIPDNMVSAAIQKSQTVYTKSEKTVVENSTLGLFNRTVMELDRKVGIVYGSNILGLIIICAALGAVASKLGEKAKLFIDFFKCIDAIIIETLRGLVWFTPIGVTSLIAASIASAEKIEETFTSLGWFVATVTIGCILLVFVLYPLLYFIIMRRSPVAFMAASVRPVVTGFAPPSSAIAIPDMLRTCDEKLNVNKAVSGFTVPLAATLNRDGSCMFITVAAIYICQVIGAELNVATYIMMIFLVTVGSLALPAIPSASLVTLLIILSSLNIPASNIGLIMSMDWYSDRVRTSSNVMSHMLCAVITNKLCGFRKTPVTRNTNNTTELSELQSLMTTEIATDTNKVKV